MGEAKHNILTKFEQQRKISESFNGSRMMDAVSLAHFSESAVDVPLRLFRK